LYKGVTEMMMELIPTCCEQARNQVLSFGGEK